MRHSTWLILRFTAYTVAIAGLCAGLRVLAENGEIAPFVENGLVEWLQFALIVAALAMLVLPIARNCEDRDLALATAMLFAIAAFRELDGVFDRIWPNPGWKIAPLVLGPALVVLIARRHARLRRQLDRFAGSIPFIVGWAGFMMVAVIARLIGHGPFLEAFMGELYHVDYKRAIEESGELVGYAILLIASLEWSFFRTGDDAPVAGPRPNSPESRRLPTQACAGQDFVAQSSAR